MIGIALVPGIGQSDTTDIDTTYVPFVAYWAIGDSYDFRITKIEQRWKEETQVKDDTTSYIGNFTVIDSTENSYTIKWTYSTQLGGLDLTPNLIEKLSRFQMTEVIYKTTELGEFLEVENWQEISDMMNELFDLLIDHYSEEKNVDKQALENVITPMKAIFASKEGIEGYVLKELQYFHFPLGLEYPANEPVEYEEELPNLLGGGPIRGHSRLYFESVDFDQAYCVLIHEMKLNPDDTRDMVAAFFRSMGQTGDELEKVVNNAVFDITDYNRFEYFFFPGVPLYIKTRRELVMDLDEEHQRRIDVIQIELLDP